MADPQGLASFPGIIDIQSCTYTITQGVSASVAVLSIAPQESITELDGELVMEYNGDQIIKLRECRIDTASFEFDESGQIIKLSIMDARWKWQFGSISGMYNLRRRNDSLVKEVKKTPKELAKLLFKKMGVKDYNIDALPDKAYPKIEWDYEVPAKALEALCDKFGCRVVPKRDGSVHVCEVGKGKELPTDDNDVSNFSATIDPAEKPSKIVIVCGRTLYQLDFILEPIAAKSKTQLFPLDSKELDYKPSGGWINIDIPHFSGILDKKKRKLAQATVFRWYRIKGVWDEGGKKLFDGSDSALKRLNQILPVDTDLLEREELGEDAGDAVDFKRTVDSDSAAPFRPAVVFGVYWNEEQQDGKVDQDDLNTAKKLKPITDYESDYAKAVQVLDGFTIDAGAGIVKFSKPKFKLVRVDGKIQQQPADLILRTTVSIRNAETWAWVRYERERKLSGGGSTEPLYIEQESIVRKKVTVYNDSDSYSVKNVVDNKSDIDKECDFFLDAAEKKYNIDSPVSVDYVGLKKLDLDVAIMVITWTVGVGGGAKTHAQRNNDENEYSPTFKEAQFNRSLSVAAKKAVRPPSAVANDVRQYGFGASF